MLYLIALFIGLPIIELVLLVKVGQAMGLMHTLILVILTGMAGISMVRRQGISLLFKIRGELQQGNLPAPQMIDGIMLLVAGAFLITPGLITDSVGLLLLIPAIRQVLRGWMRKKLEEKARNGQFHVHINRRN